MKKYKIVFFISEDSFDKMMQVLRDAKINTLQNYINCMSWQKVTSSWTCLQDANPYIGKPCEVSIENEYRIEFLCLESDLKRVVKVIYDNHPYEEPEIDIYPIIYGKDLLENN